MILGTFPWRGMEIEVDMIANETVGEAVWLNAIEDGSSTGVAEIHGGRFFPTKYAPADETAVIQLRAAYDAFRAATP